MKSETSDGRARLQIVIPKDKRMALNRLAAFEDVTLKDLMMPAIEWLIQNGLKKGYPLYENNN